MDDSGSGADDVGTGLELREGMGGGEREAVPCGVFRYSGAVPSLVDAPRLRARSSGGAGGADSIRHERVAAVEYAG